MEGLWLPLLVGGAVLTILWILVPFAVFGIKGLLQQILAEQRRTNQLLSKGEQSTAAEGEGADKPTLKNILAEISRP